MMNVTTIARPYARAFFEHALHEKTVLAWSDMLMLLSEITLSSVVNKLLHNPNVTKEQQANVIIALAKGRLSKEGENSVRLLAMNLRLHLLPVIAQLFEKLRLEQEKTVEVSIISAVELEPVFVNTLKTLLTKKLEKTANVCCEVDASILGGLLIRTGDTVIDGSVKSELNRLKEVLNF